MIVCFNPIQIDIQLEKLLFKIISHEHTIIFTGRMDVICCFSNRRQSIQKDWWVNARQLCEYAGKSALLKIKEREAMLPFFNIEWFRLCILSATLFVRQLPPYQ